MLKVFLVTIRYGYGGQSSVQKNILAETAEQAIEFAMRHAKKQYYSNAYVSTLNLNIFVDVYYKSSTRKRK